MAEIRLGDWRDVLPGTYDPARAVVITDPPYGLDDGLRGYGDAMPWADHVAATLELAAVRHVIRGPATALVQRDYPQPRRLCVELAGYRRRAAHRPGAVPYLWQGWAVYGRLKIATGRPSVPLGDGIFIRPYVDDGLRNGEGHRGITPYAAALWIIGLWADPGMLVIDPYAGTGTIGRAAAALGFEYLGAEIDPTWHAEAIAALEHHAPAIWR